MNYIFQSLVMAPEVFHDEFFSQDGVQLLITMLRVHNFPLLVYRVLEILGGRKRHDKVSNKLTVFIAGVLVKFESSLDWLRRKPEYFTFLYEMIDQDRQEIREKALDIFCDLVASKLSNSFQIVYKSATNCA